MSPVFYIGAFLVTFLVCKIIHRWIFMEEKLKDFPGPKGWPLVGNSLQLDPKYPQKTLSDWSQIYGDMFKIKIFNDDTVILNDYESIRDMLNSEACSARPFIYRIHEIMFKGLKDIIFQNFSAEWNDRKKALTRSMNAYGAGTTKIEQTTLECIENLLEHIDNDTKNFSESIDLRPYIHICTASSFTTLFYGRKLEESELLELLELERGMMKLAIPAGLIAVLDHFPWMRHLPVNDIQGPIKDSEKFRDWVMKMQKERNADDPIDEQCILDSLMGHVNRITGKLMTQEELGGIAFNIICGGFATLTAAMYSLFLVLINFPEIQEKIYEEIQQVTKGARPKVFDRSNMPYVKAAIEEVFRYAPIFPLDVPHYCAEDTTISGKHVLKGTVLLANIWKLHHDERYFDEPWKFKPERFLNSNGEIVASDDAVNKQFMPFGAGRRICPGEGLARSRMFLIMTTLLQKFRFLPEDEHNIPSCDPRLYDSGVVLIPYKYKVKVVER